MFSFFGRLFSFFSACSAFLAACLAFLAACLAKKLVKSQQAKQPFQAVTTEEIEPLSRPGV